jgi:probable rRNA maturation factor
MKTSHAFSLANATRARAPALPYRAIARAVLGERYELSLVLVGDARSRALNRRYRGKDAPANVLSFPLSKSEGELVLNLAAARRDAPRYGHSYRAMVGYLLIHGLLHLKGMTHGRRMEGEERALLRRHVSPPPARHRH